MSPHRRLATLVLAAVATLAFAVPAGAFHILVIIVLGPTTPKAASTHGMKLRVTPRSAPVGTTFDGVATRFRAGEYVTLWEFRGKGWKKSKRLPGGVAKSDGSLELIRDSGYGGTGRRKLCAQGERTRRVACGTYEVTEPVDAPGPDDEGGDTPSGDLAPEIGPGYVPPQVGPGYVPPESG